MHINATIFFVQIKFGLLKCIICFGLYFSFLDYFRVNASTAATNVDTDSKNQTGATFSSCITVFREKPYQPLSFKFPTRIFGNNPKEDPFKLEWYWKYYWLH